MSWLTPLSELLQTSPPPFVFIEDPHGATPSPELQIQKSSSKSGAFTTITVDAVECYTSRILFSTILNKLASFTPEYDSRGYAECFNVDEAAGGGQKWDSSWDGFIHAFRDTYTAPYAKKDSPEKTHNVAIAIKNSKRLKQSMPELVVPLVRLRELVREPPSPIYIPVKG